MARLEDKVVLITGGESGIGLATARLFVAEGARVHLVGIDEGKLAAAVAELGARARVERGRRRHRRGGGRRAVAAGVERYGRYDVLFSNAGISGAVAPIVEYPSDVFARMLAVHILGAFQSIKHGAPHVPDGGSIVITSSVIGLIGPPAFARTSRPSTARSASCGPPPRSSPRAASASTRCTPGRRRRRSRTTSRCARPASRRRRRRGSSTA